MFPAKRSATTSNSGTEPTVRSNPPRNSEGLVAPLRQALRPRLVFRPWRFSELSRAIPGLSQRILIGGTRNPLRDGLISRPLYPTVPPRAECSLSPRGESLAVVANAMADRARANHSNIVRGREESDAGRSWTIPRSPRSRRDPSRHTGDPLVTSVPEN
ncbi:winged helix-turn-helix transcriptional regulator [Nocardia sp. NPDC002869]|uniref:winged helix-turn-helix transcriptional regulator n=1 Tax=Nocardia sp. NPDC002869 TaxID=3161032 RepID=UPI00398CD95E